MKPPCVECDRYKTQIVFYQNCTDTEHLCVSKRRNCVTGDSVIHECWWYRRTPFCKFEPKEDNNE